VTKRNKKNKKPVIVSPPAPTKRPYWIGEPTFEGRHLSWRFSSVDAGGPWAWPQVPNDSLKRIMHKLPEFEKAYYDSGLKDVRSIVSTADLAQSAKQRLKDLQRDDIETLFGWHVSGKERLWCAEYDGMMCVLWWDPDHEVYPVSLKNT
jgi:hypothetical protein